MRRRGRVLIVTPWYGRLWAGGVAIAVENLVGTLGELGFHPVVLVPVGDGLRPRVEQGERGEVVVYLPLRAWHTQRQSLKAFFGYWTRLPLAWLSVLFLILRYRISLVHFHYCIEVFDELRRIFRTLRRPFIWTCHGSDVLKGFDEEPLASVQRKFIRDARRITAVSHGLLRTLLVKEPQCEAKARVVWNSIPLAFWEKTRKPLAAGRHDVDLLFIGSLQEVKGPDLLVDAFVEIARKRPETTLTIIGKGEIEETLRAKVNGARLSHHVKFVGKIPYDRLMAYYRRSKVVVVPSRFESFCFVAVEAALMERPVVAADVGGLPEVVADGQSGLLVPAENAGKLAEAILALLDSPQGAETFGKQARQRALRLFAPRLSARAYLDVYREVLGRPLEGIPAGSPNP